MQDSAPTVQAYRAPFWIFAGDVAADSKNESKKDVAEAIFVTSERYGYLFKQVIWDLFEKL